MYNSIIVNKIKILRVDIGDSNMFKLNFDVKRHFREWLRGFNNKEGYKNCSN